MAASELPNDLMRGQSLLQAWRGRRKLGDRIPLSLWMLAVRLAKAHGVSRTAMALGLDYYGLKKRVAATADEPRSSKQAFVELPAPLVVGKQCLFEFENGTGATMRVQLMGYDAADVEVLSRASGTPSDATDHATDEGPGRHRANRFPPSHTVNLMPCRSASPKCSCLIAGTLVH